MNNEENEFLAGLNQADQSFEENENLFGQEPEVKEEVVDEEFGSSFTSALLKLGETDIPQAMASSSILIEKCLINCVNTDAADLNTILVFNPPISLAPRLRHNSSGWMDRSATVTIFSQNELSPS